MKEAEENRRKKNTAKLKLFLPVDVKLVKLNHFSNFSFFALSMKTQIQAFSPTFKFTLKVNLGVVVSK